MKNIKLYQVLLSLIVLIALLLTISSFIPENGVQLLGVNFKFPTIDRLMHPKKQENANIDSLIMDVDTTFVDPLIQHQNGSNGDMGAPNAGELRIKNTTIIHLNEAGIANLDKFFEKLSKVATEKKKIHILHYGDSQIEGDRMTGFIRERLQNQFGGNGPGLVPANNVYNTFAFVQSYSENFVRYTCFGGEKLNNKKYGVMGSAARFTKEYKDSSEIATETTQKTAWIELAASPNAYGRARNLTTVKMYYNSCIKPCTINVYENGTLIHQDSLKADGKSHIFKLSFPSTPGKLKFEFKSAISPTISNFSLEGDYGVQMSNIGMRGSSGTIFGAMDRGVATEAMNDLNTELIIMQFGGNSVPSFKDSAGVRNYANYFKGQLKTLKGMRPSAAIIVIGPSDMSLMTDGIYETYPLLPYCVEQMKKISLEVGAGYWDLYDAMGGKNSMPAWVEKGLAGSDYIHFSNGGARIAAQKFYDALIAEYIRWSGKGN
ncbi:MAG: hypothetical protein M9916_08430 [Crocinitomicaceae bacterium]|nr:hypothetical protein [Crocinitomicaceae bacterium]